MSDQDNNKSKDLDDIELRLTKAIIKSSENLGSQFSKDLDGLESRLREYIAAVNKRAEDADNNARDAQIKTANIEGRVTGKAIYISIGIPTLITILVEILPKVLDIIGKAQ